MHELAQKIENNLDVLAAEYAQRLQEAGDDAPLSERDRLDAARNVLHLLAADIQAGDRALFKDLAEDVEIQSLQDSLERRNTQVEISSQVAQELTALPALEDLYERVVTLIKERFDYYHAQIFRYEPVVDACVLVTSYGQAGKALLAERHRLPMGRGVVGTAAAMGRPVIASDVTQDPDWVANPYLPETKGELAVPIKLRDQVLGILDVQSDRAGALGQEDQILLEGLCGQIAAAIESTRLRQEMEGSIRELQDLYRVLRRERWETLELDVELRGYLYDQKQVVRADDLWAPEIAQAVERQVILRTVAWWLPPPCRCWARWWEPSAFNRIRKTHFLLKSWPSWGQPPSRWPRPSKVLSSLAKNSGHVPF
jgi:GAF domain-containing protein